MTDQDLKGLETLREVETEWLADQLTESIANLSYPVGMGEGPTPDHARKAAETLFDRYSQMIAAISARAQAAEAERDALRERLQAVCDAGAPIQPISYNETPDYAELTFGEHRTQAMTMAPVDWLALDAALTLARSALSEGESQA